MQLGLLKRTSAFVSVTQRCAVSSSWGVFVEFSLEFEAVRLSGVGDFEGGGGVWVDGFCGVEGERCNKYLFVASSLLNCYVM